MAPLAKTIAALGLLVTFSAVPAMADTYRHIDDLANDIERKARKIVSESRHYRHTPEYRHILQDAKDMRELADHLHDVAHDHGSLAHMEADVRQLDAEFHHLQSLFRRVEREADYGHGHVHGHTGHVWTLLHAIEEDIHHLQDDLRSLRQPLHHGSSFTVARPPVYVAPPRDCRNDYRSPGYGQYGGYGRGITIGGGSSRFTIRF